MSSLKLQLDRMKDYYVIFKASVRQNIMSSLKIQFDRMKDYYVVFKASV